MSMFRQSCQPLQIQEPASNECFPELERLLEKERDYQKALRMIKRPSPEEQYRSIMDWLLCSTLPHYKRPCFRFYEDDEAPNLMQMTTPAERKFIERMLHAAIVRAHMAWKDELSITWKRLRDDVNAAEEFVDRIHREG